MFLADCRAQGVYSVDLPSLLNATSVQDVEGLLQSLDESRAYTWQPVGSRENNAGTIDLASDAKRALVERITNAIDAVLERCAAEDKRDLPEPGSPRRAVERWRGVAGGHIHRLENDQRQALADEIEVVFLDSGDPKFPTIVIRDLGIGQHPSDFSSTLLSLSQSNKLRRPCLAGVYGQGGAATYAWSEYTIIVSRKTPSALASGQEDRVGWTIVRRYEGDPESKAPVYQYLAERKGSVPSLDPQGQQQPFPPGTHVAHIAYEMGSEGRRMTLAPYQIFNQLMFDPVLPYWFRDPRFGDNRTMPGNLTRLVHSEHVEYWNRYVARLGAAGELVIRYWVLKPRPEKESGDPYIVSYLRSRRDPNVIAITLHGQTHDFLEKGFLREETSYSFLTDYLLVQVECDDLGRTLKQHLFTSTRERLRQGEDRAERVHREIAAALEADEKLHELEEARKDAQISQADRAVEEKVRALLDRYISRGRSPVGGRGKRRRRRPPSGTRTRRPPEPFVASDPPTFLRIANKANPIPLTSSARSIIKLESDAPDGQLSRPRNPGTLDVVLGHPTLRVAGRTDFRGGELRVHVDTPATVPPGTTGSVSCELSSHGSRLSSGSRLWVVVEASRGEDTGTGKAPDYEVIPVTRDEARWTEKNWDETVVGDFEDSDKVYFFINLDNEAYQEEIRSPDMSPHRSETLKVRYMALVAYHMWLQFDAITAPAAANGVDDPLAPENMQHELRRVANSLLLSMRPQHAFADA